MMKKLLKKGLFMLLFAAMTTAVSAQWQLNNEESSIDFVTIKKSKAGELNTFGKLKGVIEQNGKAMVVISLASVETKIPVRNERMQSMLFEVVRYPEATISARVDHARIDEMKPGDTFIQPVKLKLSLHGEEREVEADLRVVRLDKSSILVSTVRPLIIDADDFSLANGVEKLREVAKLPSISTAVPVTVDLLFEKTEK